MGTLSDVPAMQTPPLKLSDRLRKNVSIKLESGVGVLAGPDVKCDPEKWQRGTQIISGRVAARCQTAGNLLRHSTITPIPLPPPPHSVDDPLWLSVWLIYRPQLAANWVILTPVDRRTGKSSHTVVIRHWHRHHYYHHRSRPPFDVWRQDWGLNRGWYLGPDSCLTLYG